MEKNNEESLGFAENQYRNVSLKKKSNKSFDVAQKTTIPDICQCIWVL